MSGGRYFADAFDEAHEVDGSQLIENNLGLFAAEFAAHAAWVWLALGSHRRDDDGVDVAIQLIRRHDDARARLLDIGPDRWIKIDQPNITSRQACEGGRAGRRGT